jgi:hypothetical protein
VRKADKRQERRMNSKANLGRLVRSAIAFGFAGTGIAHWTYNALPVEVAALCTSIRATMR